MDTPRKVLGGPGLVKRCGTALAVPNAPCSLPLPGFVWVCALDVRQGLIMCVPWTYVSSFAPPLVLGIFARTRNSGSLG